MPEEFPVVEVGTELARLLLAVHAEHLLHLDLVAVGGMGKGRLGRVAAVKPASAGLCCGGQLAKVSRGLGKDSDANRPRMGEGPAP